MPISAGVEAVMRGRRALACYAAVALLATAVYPVLPAATRPFAFFVIGLTTLVPAGLANRVMPRPYRRISLVIISALSLLSVGNLLSAIRLLDHQTRSSPAQWVTTVGHVLMLGATLMIVRRRGRNDLGGVLDTTVIALGVVGVAWNLVLEPQLLSSGAAPGSQSSLLIIMLCLGGITGALARLERTSRSPLPALRLLLVLVPLAMIGDVGLALTQSFRLAERPGWIEPLFLLVYVMLGVAVADPSFRELLTAGPETADQHSWRRLLLLGVTLALGPTAAGVQQVLGHTVDAISVAITSAAVVPLVMVRIGWLSVQRQRAELALIHQATHDPLTGLPNRAELLHRLGVAMRPDSAVRPLVCFGDLDGFKPVNDRLGHLAGDDLLRLVARRLAGVARDGETLARYGGDEFVLLCPSPSQWPDAAGELRRRIERAFAEPFELAGQRIDIGISVGVVAAAPGFDAVSVVRQADDAMYQAKRDRQAREAVEMHAA